MVVPKLKKIREWTAKEKEFIESQIELLRPWAYSFDFGDGLTTRQGVDPRGKFDRFWDDELPEDLGGASCIDIASNNGQLGMWLMDRGSERVTAIDHNKIWIDQGRFLCELLGYPIEIIQKSVYDIPKGFGKFDYVFALGLIYHLPDMFRFFSTMRDLARDVCFIETEVLRIDPATTNFALFIEGRYTSDNSNWWIPGIGCVLSMARAAGFRTAEIVDYAEPPEKVTPEGYRREARGIFRFSVEEAPKLAARFKVRNEDKRRSALQLNDSVGDWKAQYAGVEEEKIKAKGGTSETRLKCSTLGGEEGMWGGLLYGCARGNVCDSRTYPCKPQADYRVSFSIRGVSDYSGVKLNLSVIDGNNSRLHESTIRLTDSWEKVEQIITTREASEFLGVQLVKSKNPTPVVFVIEGFTITALRGRAEK